MSGRTEHTQACPLRDPARVLVLAWAGLGRERCREGSWRQEGWGAASWHSSFSELEPCPDIQPQLLALIMHFEGRRGGKQSLFECLLPGGVSLPLTMGRGCGRQLGLCRGGRAARMSTTLHSLPRLQGDPAVSLSQICLLLPFLSPTPAPPPICPESGVPGLPQPQSSHMPVWGGGFCDGHGFPSTFFPNTYDWKPSLV